MTKEDQHQKIKSDMEDYYLSNGMDPATEFTQDGPSHWVKYASKGNPRIVFLAKEAHSSYHPSDPKAVDSKFTKNIARWANIILSLMHVTTAANVFTDGLQEAYDSIAIVEVKKSDEGKKQSINKEIRKFAWLGRGFLQQQLQILDPHFIICCGTLESYDIINNYSEEEKKLKERLIYENDKIKAWTSADTVVLHFCHPSNRINDEKMFLEMQHFISDANVQSEYQRIKLIKP